MLRVRFERCKNILLAFQVFKYHTDLGHLVRRQLTDQSVIYLEHRPAGPLSPASAGAGRRNTSSWHRSRRAAAAEPCIVSEQSAVAVSPPTATATIPALPASGGTLRPDLDTALTDAAVSAKQKADLRAVDKIVEGDIPVTVFSPPDGQLSYSAPSLDAADRQILRLERFADLEAAELLPVATRQLADLNRLRSWFGAIACEPERFPIVDNKLKLAQADPAIRELSKRYREHPDRRAINADFLLRRAQYSISLQHVEHSVAQAPARSQDPPPKRKIAPASAYALPAASKQHPAPRRRDQDRGR